MMAKLNFPKQSFLQTSASHDDSEIILMLKIKGMVHPKMKILSLITHPLPFQIRNIFVHHLNTNYDFFRQQHHYHIQGPER